MLAIYSDSFPPVPKKQHRQVIDVLTYKGDGVAETRQNENGKIDYFVAGLHWGQLGGVQMGRHFFSLD